MLTPTQQAAYAAATLKRTGKAPVDDQRMFAAGIAYERARCAKICRELAQRTRHAAMERVDQALWHEAEGAADCAAAIEAPADGGQPERT